MFNPLNLTGKKILVTGASSGIGRETAILLSELGADLVLVARSEEELLKTSKLLKGVNHHVEPFDLSNTDDIPQWLKEVVSRFAPLSGLVHCAGIEAIRPLKLVNGKTFKDMMDINVGAALSLTKAYRQKNVHSPGGCVVYVSSVSGLVGQVGHTEYCTSKGALISLCKAAALELAREGVRVNCVAPGLIMTELVEKAQQTLSEEQLKAIEAYHPLGIGQPRDVANAIAFLLADTGRWITGSTLVVDGGYTVH